MRLDFYLHLETLSSEDQAKVNQIYREATGIIRKIDAVLTAPGGPRPHEGTHDMARTPDEALEATRAASTRTDSLIADRAGLKQQLDDALSGVTIPPAVQAKIDEIFDIETADAAKIDAALNANVPPPAP